MFRQLLVATFVLGLAACASDGPRHQGDVPFGGNPPRRSLFVSPSGEPFRGGGGLAVWFAGADANHDGAVTLAEFQADARRFFQTLDTNDDKQIDGLEIQAYEQTIAPEIAALDGDREPGGGGYGLRRGGGRRSRAERSARPADDGPRGVGREGAARFSLINEPEPVANADDNIDGRVSQAEWTRATLRRFKVLDRAADSRLTLDALTGVTRPKP